ncbi:MAG TPA: long-chain fatty acid--CoA ligase, partial [Propionibacteriaceae bacterium]|nr:long-chain fatty acid--CoA ligase [Propionibacteriaceae bacterium]
MPNTQADVLARSAQNIGDMLRRRVELTPDATAYLVPNRVDGPNTWTPMTWAEAQTQVHECAAAFLALGLTAEQRVAIASSTRMEWILADLGIACASGVTTTVYPNTQIDDVVYILQDSESVIFVAENSEQAAKVQEHADLDGQIHHIILIEDDRTEAGRADARVLSWAEFIALGRAHLATSPNSVDDAINATQREHLSTLIYTSGTTGRPKGVELTHEAWVYEGTAIVDLDIIDFHAVQYFWLPLSHVFGKCLVTIQLAIGFATAVDGRLDRIMPGLGEVHPTFMCAAPRIFEKVRNAVLTSSPRDGVKGRIARWAFAVGRESRSYRLAGEPMPKLLAAKYKVADKLVFSKLKEKMGGNIEFFISGAAKLSSQVQEWFYSAGITVVEGYGMTETSAVAFVNVPASPRFGTVGKVIPGIGAKIAEDGELLLQGPTITKGYHNSPEANEEAYTDGWFHTGDIGEIDADGYLTITDRKKDLMKTSGGKYVAPQKVEAAIAANIPYVSQAVALGEGRKYIVALL